jgi:alpha-glucosidase
VYVRGGSILPLQPLIQSTDETPNGPLELRIYPGPQCAGSLYLDDGHTFRYQHGEFLRQTFTCEADSNSVRLNFAARQGSYTPWWKTVEVVIFDWPSKQANATLSNSTLQLKTSYDAAKHALHIVMPDSGKEAELRVVKH